MTVFDIVLDNCFIVTALFLNILSLYLIITRSRKEIGSYKYLLIAFLSTDLFFSVVHKLCQPVLSFRDGFFVSHCEGLVDGAFFLTLYGATGSLTFPLLSYHFLYRAVVVSSDDKIRAKIAATHENLANRTELIVIVPFIDGKLNAKVVWNAAPLLAIASSAFAIIVISAWRITRTLYLHSSTISMSPTSMAMHKRLFIALIVQMLVPTLTMFAPSMVAIALPFFPMFSFNIPDWVLVSCYSLYPILDPIVITLCIRDYRSGLFQLLRTLCNRSYSHQHPTKVSPSVFTTRVDGKIGASTMF